MKVNYSLSSVQLRRSMYMQSRLTLACFLPIVQQRITFVGDWGVFGGWLETEVGGIILVLPTKLPKRAGNTAGSGSVLGLFITHHS